MFQSDSGMATRRCDRHSTFRRVRPVNPSSPAASASLPCRRRGFHGFCHRIHQDAARCDRHRQDRSTWSTLAPSSPLETLASGASSLHSRTVSLRPMLLLVAASPEALLQPSSKLAQLVGVLNLSKALTSPARRRSCPSMALSKTSLFRNPKNIGQASAENSWRCIMPCTEWCIASAQGVR